MHSNKTITTSSHVDHELTKRREDKLMQSDSQDEDDDPDEGMFTKPEELEYSELHIMT